MGLVKVFVAQSLDGFIAGPNDDISWLPHPPDDDCGWEDFIIGVGCVLTGRKSYDVIRGMETEWPYKTQDTIVATTRELPNPPARVTWAKDAIRELIRQAKDRACGQDVYLEGGALIRQALDACLIDDMCITIVPIILGSGTALFAGCRHRQGLKLVRHRDLPMGMYQLSYVMEDKQ